MNWRHSVLSERMIEDEGRKRGLGRPYNKDGNPVFLLLLGRGKITV